MNRKTFCTLGLMFFSLALPSLLPAQNLILDGGFDSGTMVFGYLRNGMSSYGSWAGVAADSYGWTVVETDSNKVLSACGKGFAREKQWLNLGKRIFQEVSGKSVLPGTYTLRFKCRAAKTLASLGHMEVAVAQRTSGMPVIAIHLEKAEDKILKGYNVLKEIPLLTGDVAELTGMETWRTVEMIVDVPEGGKSLMVIFTGLVDTGTFQIDDVTLTRKGGSPVPPEKTTVDARQLFKPLEKIAAKPAVPKPDPAPVAVTAAPKPQPAPVAVAKPAPVPLPAAAPAPVPITVTATPAPRPVPEPVRPPVDNLILNGDFSAASLALPTATGDTTAELSGRWLRSAVSPWEISPYGGNLGPYVRAAASKEAGRLLYVASDTKRSKGSYQLRFDYILTNPSDTLGVKVFVSDRDITVGTDSGDFRMNGSQLSADMTLLPAGASWAAYALPVELGDGYNYIYVLFTGSGAGNTGIDNVSLAPRRR